MNLRKLTLALGANLGDRHATLEQARTLISQQIGPIIAASKLHETKAWGVADQPDFLNQVIVVKLGARAGAEQGSKAMLHSLLDRAQAIEQNLGRERKEHWGPRTCDIDLVFLDDLRYEDERISLPHPWWRERDFVGGIILRELGDTLVFPGSF